MDVGDDLDVLRGVAVLIMIEAHVIDSWTRAADRSTHAFRQSLVLGGFGAPLFLFLAGVSLALAGQAGPTRDRGQAPAAAVPSESASRGAAARGDGPP
jgi:uncharacterized membrane protein